MSNKRIIRKIFTPIAVVLAVIYFLIDALFLAIVKPLAHWIASLPIFPRLHAWVESRDRYTTLVLFLIPWLFLEPVKPLGIYLIASHHMLLGGLLLSIVEVIKLTMFERLFQMCRSKLVTFAWFAFCYEHIGEAWNGLQSLRAWQVVLHYLRRAKLLARSCYTVIRRLVQGDPPASP